MPRRSKNDVEYNNIEKILVPFKERLTNYSEILKFDGITIEFSCGDKNVSDCEKEVKALAKSIGLKNYLTESSKYDNTKFILQFPDMTPIYTETEIQKLYKDNFKWLIDDTVLNKPDATKSLILEHADNFVKMAINSYYRSNVNRYKEKLDDYLSDVNYRTRLLKLFKTYLDEYWLNK